MATVPRLIEISIDAVPIGTPLQFALRSNSGHLLASKGYTITSRSELEKIRTRGLGLAIDMNESDAALRSYLQRVNSMILDDASLANIAMARIESFSSGTIEPMTVAGGFPDIQEKIQAHRASLPKKGQGPQAAKTKPAGLGCPTQMARLRDSFKQASVPVEAVVAKPIKKVRLPPRSQKA